MLTVYLNLNGVLGDYVKQIRTKSTTKSIGLINMQAELNQCVEKHVSIAATAGNCKKFFEELQEIAQRKTNALTEQEMTWDKFKEIEDWYMHAGYQLAIGYTRKGVSMETYTKYKNYMMFDEDIYKRVHYLFKVVVCIASLTPGDLRIVQDVRLAAMSELDKLEKMTDDEIVEYLENKESRIYSLMSEFERVSRHRFSVHGTENY